MSYRSKYCDVNVLTGRTLKSIDNKGDELLFETTDGVKYRMYHEQDCCENVSLEEVIGDLDDLIGSPLVQAEEVSSEGAPPPESPDSWTWTFYKFRTMKGDVTLRWLGESNGYYSESVDFLAL